MCICYILWIQHGIWSRWFLILGCSKNHGMKCVLLFNIQFIVVFYVMKYTLQYVIIGFL